jgi:hypothetical protein
MADPRLRGVILGQLFVQVWAQETKAAFPSMNLVTSYRTLTSGSPPMAPM